MQTATLAVTGMICGGCPIKLAQALQDTEGVTDVDISLASGEVTVRYDEHRMSPDLLRGVVIKTGFGTGGVPATNGHDPRPDHCG